MSNNYNSFQLSLIIIDHFDDIINKVDISTETLLENIEKSGIKRKLDDEADDKRKKLNETREKQIEKIKEIRQINLNNLSSKRKEKEGEYDDNSLENLHEIEEIKENLICNDCVVLEKGDGMDLWVTSWFYNKNDLEFLE